MSEQSAKRPGEPKQIEKLFVALAAKDGDEGVVARYSPEMGGWTPIVFTSESVLDRFADVLKRTAESGERVEIVEFQRVGTRKVIEP